MVESATYANPEDSTIQSTANPEESNPDEDTTANPDGHKDADLDPEEQGVTGQADEEKKASRLKVYVYQNEIMSREKIRTSVNEALKRYIYNI